MSAFVPQIIRAIATGAALETGRTAARRGQGMGFAQGESGGGDDWYDLYGDFDYLFDYGGNYSGAWGGDWGGWFEDPFGNYFEYDWFNLPVDDSFQADTLTIDTFAAGTEPSYRDITGDLDYQNSLWDWLTNLGPGPAQLDPQYGPAGTGQELPGYCPKGTYHPVNDPMACVPFPPNDPNAKKQASAAKKAQQTQDKACPKHPQGLPVWRNPQTGKCEVVPQCPQGAKFDSTTRRCLTPAQAKELYGDNNWLWWLLIGGGALLLVTRNNSSGGRRR